MRVPSDVGEVCRTPDLLVGRHLQAACVPLSSALMRQQPKAGSILDLAVG